MNDIVEKDQTNIAVVDPVYSIIERIATDPKADVGKLERMLALKEREDAKRAEQEFNIAMVKAQAEMRPISANMENKQTRSKYADYAKLDKVLRPIYSENGFCLSFNTGESAPDFLKVICIVSHIAGHSKEYSVPMPADGKGAKGGDVMTKTHATGAAMTYGMRYLLKLIFNVAIGEDDTDGNMPIQLISEDQVNQIHAKITDNDISMDGFMEWLKNTLKCDSIDKININSFDIVIKRIDSAIRAQNGNS